jgi:hypothetical protein
MRVPQVHPYIVICSGAPIYSNLFRCNVPEAHIPEVRVPQVHPYIVICSGACTPVHVPQARVMYLRCNVPQVHVPEVSWVLFY